MFALSYGRFLSDPSVRMLVRVFASEHRRFPVVAQAFDARGRETFRDALLAMLEQLNQEGRIRTPRPEAAAAQLMGMIEHAALLEPLLLAADALDQTPIEPVCEDAVATFLARYGVQASAEAA